MAPNQLPTPASLLLSADPTHPSQRKNSPSPPLSSDHEPPPEKDRAWAIEQDDLLLRQLQSQPAELRPALPLLPPTPLTPLEIIKSSTLSRLFRKSNRVFSQIADSATGLIESDSSTCNKLNELVELLRGDLSSRSWIDVIEQSIAPAQAAPEKADTGQLHYQVLAQTLETIHGLFTTPAPITVPAIANGPPQPAETLSPADQLGCLEACAAQLGRFLGDIQDYRDRLVEIRDGCLAIEKRRRALWTLVKLSAAAFDRAPSRKPVTGGRPTGGDKPKTPQKPKKAKKAPRPSSHQQQQRAGGAPSDSDPVDQPRLSDSADSVEPAVKPRKKPGPKKGAPKKPRPPGLPPAAALLPPPPVGPAPPAPLALHSGPAAFPHPPGPPASDPPGAAFPPATDLSPAGLLKRKRKIP
ncbi:hypothetical protein PtA15_16A169 [Puccinia triticina]|uniref:Inhibitor of growth protein N-terminal histone-binding domain-containing protein n=1 Tax=Puccinia triticina TaxID=208348 RepID=A0ABY7D6N8_9BASI|nr:uncharacterized protein PtA15_16A169 [Puccinia triticina]WAQ92263.1 hypothetical protein PtA15_16A169 [Puccinia triticina]